MNPTLRDCNEALDWIKETFKLNDDEYRIHIHDEDGTFFIDVICYLSELPGTEELYAPPGWAMDDWWRVKGQFWRTAIYRC
jgi:hypothetical protein